MKELINLDRAFAFTNRLCVFVLAVMPWCFAKPGITNDAIQLHRSRTPNIVLIISDDQAWTDYGFMGHEAIQTPNLDRLAKNSLTFKRGYVPTSLCRPSLATIITGLYPAQHGITGNDPASPSNVSPKERRRNKEYQQRIATLNARIKNLDTLPRLLREKNYLSHQSGKWWEGSFEDGGFTHGMTHGDPSKGGRHGDLGLKIGREGIEPIKQFINDCGDQPFFVWYAPFLPHTPHNPPADLVKKYRKTGRPMELTKYYAMCEWFDQTCGELIDFIDEKNLGSETVIMYVTDNGWIQKTSQTEAPESWGKGFAPGSKQSPSEGGIRTPIMFRWTGQIAPRMDSKTLVSSVDLAPTILSLAGVAVPQAMKGMDVIGNATGLAERNQVFGEIYAHDIANLDRTSESLLYRWCISGDKKAVFCLPGKTGRYGNIHRFMQGDRQPRLYDLIADPFERKDLVQDHRDELDKLRVDTEAFFDGLPLSQE